MRGHTGCTSPGSGTAEAMMTLVHQLENEVVNVVAGLTTLASLEDWLAAREHLIAPETDQEADALAGEVRLALAEYHEGYLDEEAAREQLADLVGAIGPLLRIIDTEMVGTVSEARPIRVLRDATAALGA